MKLLVKILLCATIALPIYAKSEFVTIGTKGFAPDQEYTISNGHYRNESITVTGKTKNIAKAQLKGRKRYFDIRCSKTGKDLPVTYEENTKIKQKVGTFFPTGEFKKCAIYECTPSWDFQYEYE